MKVYTDTSQVKANWWSLQVGMEKKALTRAMAACKMLRAVLICSSKDLEE